MKINQDNINYTDHIYYICRTILIIGLPLTIISGLALSHLSIRSSATDGSGADKVTLSIPVSCTINATINNEHTVSMVSGTYKDNIGKTTMKTTCNDKNGFVIYAIGSTNDIDGNNKLSSIDLGENYDIPTGLNTSKPAEGEDISNWAMKLIPVNGNYVPIVETAYNNIYGLVPDNWTKVASRNPGTFDMQEGSTFTTTYAIYLKGTQPAGTYTGQVKYALLHPASSISPTTLERAFFLAGKQKIDIYDDNGTNTTESTNPTTGEPNTLIGSYYKMQNMTTSICNTTNITGEASQVQLLDIRDNNIYWATKLLDGHCWMTQNLDLDLDSSVALTSEDTDLNVMYDTNISTTDYLEYKDGYSMENDIIRWLPKDNTANSLSNWKNSNNSPSSLNIGKYYLDTSIGEHSLTGNYYNWTSTIASNNSTALVDDTYAEPNNNPKNSICPKGWRLPIITNYSNTEPGDNDFVNLNYYYNGAKINTGIGLMSAPVYMMKSGFIIGSSLNDRDSNSFYWSATLKDTNFPYGIRISNSTFNIITDYYRSRGFSIRCLAK